MSAGEPLYFVLFRIDPSQRGRMAELRTEHLLHVISMGDRIVHGGLLMGSDGPDGVSMVLRATSAEEVGELIAKDPYRDLCSSVEIAPFVQRIPEGSQGELRQLLDEALRG